MAGRFNRGFQRFFKKFEKGKEGRDNGINRIGSQSCLILLIPLSRLLFSVVLF